MNLSGRASSDSEAHQPSLQTRTETTGYTPPATNIHHESISYLSTPLLPPLEPISPLLCPIVSIPQSNKSTIATTDNNLNIYECHIKSTISHKPESAVVPQSLQRSFSEPLIDTHITSSSVSVASMDSYQASFPTTVAHVSHSSNINTYPMLRSLSVSPYSPPFITPLRTTSSSTSLHTFPIPFTASPLNIPDQSLMLQHPNQALPESLQSLLEVGTRMVKYPNKASSRPELRLIRVDSMPMRITWESKKKTESTVDFDSILEIRMGQNTKAFDIHGKHPDMDERAFSIIYMSKGKYKFLNLIAPSPEICALWVTGLHIRMTQFGHENGSDASIAHLTDMSQWLKTLWYEADVSGLGQLNVDQITALMERLNFRLSKSEIKSTFRANILRTGTITFDAFEKLYNILRFRPDIAEIFFQIALLHPSHITLEEFRQFLINVQKVDWSAERCSETYDKFKSPISGVMDINHFSAFLISARNSVLKKSHQAVFQDMNRPLTDYFINTSHNTYLLGDQLTGESSVEGYIRALQRGCRCIELDCWDGPSGQPLIYHGRTFTSRLLFKDAIEAIAKYAFVTSSYPLILSLEIHCAAEQQQVMVKILQNTFGSSLLLAPVRNDSVLPSPIELIRKIIIKGKTGKTDQDNDDTYDQTDDETIDTSGGSSSIVNTPLMSSNPGSGLSHTASVSSSSNIIVSNIPMSSTSTLPPQNQSSQESNTLLLNSKDTSNVTKTKPKVIITKALEALIIYCKGVSLHSVTLPQNPLKFDCMYSFSERTANALLQKQRDRLVHINQSHLSRVYPSVIRITSSNMDPVPLWKCGTHMVALNFQTFDRAMHLNSALFDVNGRCGYVLKPQYLLKGGSISTSTDKAVVINEREKYKTDFTRPVQLDITIISAQQRPKSNDAIATDSISLVVEIEVIGGGTLFGTTGSGVLDADPTTKFRTSPVKSKLFNLVWKQRASFLILDPSFTFIKFAVLDADTKISKCIGMYCIFLSSLEKGYRHIPLNNMQGERLRFSTLFVYVDIQPVGH
ncbi:hypothetical protein O5D80_000303 [Batrachochytrium dendrobatidis]|nr:hypothetical protein O5D80_000303 [Batrachochytrium dendrobatidis]